MELSVIVPAYNVEEYICTCLDSLINQNCENIEIIVIDDSSTDSIKDLVSVYTQTNSNVVFVENSQNIGVGLSRNKGMSMASGTYIGFIDGDDWVDLNYYQTLLNSAYSTNADIIITGITDEYGNHISHKTRYAYDTAFVTNGRMGLKLLTKSEDFGTYVSPIMNNKIYKKDFLTNHNIKCSDNKSWQDDYFSFFSMLYANKIAFVPAVFYHYRQRITSVTHLASTSKEKIDNCIDVLKRIKARLHEEGVFCYYKKEYQAFVERCVTSLLSMIRKNGDGDSSSTISYLFDCLMNITNIGDIISYLDNERIYHFFNL